MMYVSDYTMLGDKYVAPDPETDSACSSSREPSILHYYLHTETWEALRKLGTSGGVAKESEVSGIWGGW